MLRPEDGVLVQGITGRQGAFWTERMLEVGTNIVAGVTPGKGGHEAHGVPVYDTCEQAAAAAHRLDAAVMFVPPLAARAACLEAIEAGVRLIVLLTEHIPYQDTMEVLAVARERQVRVLGPNTAGLVVPGTGALGIMPAFAENIFRPGTVGVVSRSGSLGTLFCLNIVQAGYGQSQFIGIGGDPIIGTTAREALAILEEDPRTEAIVLVGEVGGTMEEDAAEDVASMRTPVLAFIAGRRSPKGRRMGHAGAIVTGSRGSGESKVQALGGAGARVLDMPSQVGPGLREALGAAGAAQALR
jgi:succinyl-CoA synthetase alpha subunit